MRVTIDIFFIYCTRKVSHVVNRQISTETPNIGNFFKPLLLPASLHTELSYDKKNYVLFMTL